MRSDEHQVVLVGAYQRENFGDVLFLHMSRAYLDAPSIATAPVPAPPAPYLSEPVESYVPLLREGSASGVWVVGGEIGRAGVTGAYQTSVDSETFAALPVSTSAKDAAIFKETGLPWYASPYLPRLSAYPASEAAPLVVNSVGIRHLTRWPTPRLEVLTALRDAEYLSVRENQSSQLLKEVGIAHVTAPDIVHTIAKHKFHSIRKEQDLALIQVNERTLRPFGAARFAELLAKSQPLSNFRLRLFMAGSAMGHDSRDLYEELATTFNEIQPTRTLEWSSSITPWEKAEEIATAGLWVGTSLHGSIISTAYGTPRVGLALEKLQNYANSWDDPMPAGVALEDVSDAVDSALAVGHADEQRRSAELADLAEKSVIACVEVLGENPAATSERIKRRAAERVAIQRRQRGPVQVLSRIYRKLR